MTGHTSDQRAHTTTYPRITASIGDRPRGGDGVRILNAAYLHLGAPMTHIEITSADLEASVRIMRQMDVAGCGITMPYKQAVVPLLDDTTAEMRAVGACNCVHVEHGRWIGHNTDGFGALRAIQEAVPHMGSLRRAVVIGAGGVARAIGHTLAREGMSVFVAARQRDRAVQMCSELGLDGALSLDDQGAADADLIVNATPDATAESPVLLDRHPRATALLDVVVTPMTTALADLARQRGLAVAPGWRMLLHLATRHVELFAGQPPSMAVMESAYRAGQRSAAP